MRQKDVQNRYRHLRALSTRHLNAALKYVARPSILERAKDLGLLHGKTLVVDSHETMTLLMDLAVQTAKPGRSRAIDRYAKVADLSADPDDARALSSIVAAKFAVLRVEGYHKVAGLTVEDVFRGGTIWLMDEGLTVSAQPGFVFATRLSWPDDFAMTCGVLVPLTDAVLEDVVLGSMGWLRHKRSDELADDPRFATAIYSAAIATGVMDHVEMQEAFAAE
jgi:hypothetical protein